MDQIYLNPQVSISGYDNASKITAITAVTAITADCNHRTSFLTRQYFETTQILQRLNPITGSCTSKDRSCADMMALSRYFELKEPQFNVSCYV